METLYNIYFIIVTILYYFDLTRSIATLFAVFTVVPYKEIYAIKCVINCVEDIGLTAKIIGFIMVLLELLISFGTFYIIKNSGIVSVDDILSYQPFSRFFIIATLYCAFITRTQWRENDKLINKE